MPHVDDTAGPPQDAYALPLLETLKLNQPDLDDVVQTLEFFDLSQLKLLRLCIADFDNEEGSGPEELPCMTFLLDWLQQHEQVETLRLSASESKGVWPTEMLQWLKHELLWYTPPVAFRVRLHFLPSPEPIRLRRLDGNCNHWFSRPLAGRSEWCRVASQGGGIVSPPPHPRASAC